MVKKLEEDKSELKQDNASLVSELVMCGGEKLCKFRLCVQT